ncbi:MAG: hypothetical protein K6C14_05265, partial [Eubacterium sp.]|nr:hypothetical protein [Eubacterium sp.]
DKATVACIKRAKSFGTKTVALTPSGQGYAAACSDSVIVYGADYFSGCTSLRHFIGSSLALLLLALRLGYNIGIISDVYLSVSLKLAEALPGRISAALKPSPALYSLAESIRTKRSVIFTGMCGDLALCKEGAFVLRRETDIPAEAIPLSELKYESREHLKNSAVIAVVSNPSLAPKASGELLPFKDGKLDITVITSADCEEEFSFVNTLAFSDGLQPLNALTAITCIYRA